MYQEDNDQAVKDTRDSKKEVLRLTYQNDELQEKCNFLEKKFHQLGQRLGATQDDFDAIDKQLDEGTANDSEYKHDYKTNARPKKHQKKQIVEPLDPYPNEHQFSYADEEHHR